MGDVRRELLAQLAAEGDPLEVAGTRIWAAVEAFRKVCPATELELQVSRREGENVLFRARGDGVEVQVMTTRVRLARGPARVWAVAVAGFEEASRPAPSSPADARVELSALGYEGALFALDASRSGPGGRVALTHRFPLSMAEAASPSRGVYFSYFFDWMGKVRELALHPVLDRISEMASTGGWGLVTNDVEVRFVGDLGRGDIVECDLWLDRVGGPTTR